MPGAILLPYPVGSNRLWRNAKGKTFVSPAAEAWKDGAKLIAKAAGIRPLSGPVAVELILHPRLTVKGKASNTRLDLDAPIKPLLDALNGIAYQDDKQVTQIRAALGEPIPDGGLSFTITEDNQWRA